MFILVAISTHPLALFHTALNSFAPSSHPHPPLHVLPVPALCLPLGGCTRGVGLRDTPWPGCFPRIGADQPLAMGHPTATCEWDACLWLAGPPLPAFGCGTHWCPVSHVFLLGTCLHSGHSRTSSHSAACFSHCDLQSGHLKYICLVIASTDASPACAFSNSHMTFSYTSLQWGHDSLTLSSSEPVMASFSCLSFRRFFKDTNDAYFLSQKGQGTLIPHAPMSGSVSPS
ncbi:unnamed protein product [Trypanosoma congolense IL3000]|uniref:WGS project CAEQ00000000 data, annotated contig 1779 n=1 Tax=Trypanosoma congolense (strain IL3000) TaxID=1068625 RepID=F9W8U3_TRYCI|nr:unnamed protein product [Trypanosoma congolense IL3000]